MKKALIKGVSEEEEIAFIRDMLDPDEAKELLLFQRVEELARINVVLCTLTPGKVSRPPPTRAPITCTTRHDVHEYVRLLSRLRR